MGKYLALTLVLHVLGIGTLMGRFRFFTRPLGIMAVGLYFLGFYLLAGQFLKKNPRLYVPNSSLINDYYYQEPGRKQTPDAELPLPGIE